MNKKTKVLCVCALGKYRSKYLAQYLKHKGYTTKFGGIKYLDSKSKNIKPLKQIDVNWADIIIITRKKLKKIFNRDFKYKDQKIIVLDVPDSEESVPKKLLRDNNVNNHIDFQKVWTRPQLRKAIEPYLPLDK